MSGRFYAVRTVAAPSCEVGSTSVTPLARVVALSGPGFVAVRSRPAAVHVSAEGQTLRVPVRDMTRVVQGIVVAMTLLLVCLIAVRALARKEAQR
jgi:hypothetical protein